MMKNLVLTAALAAALTVPLTSNAVDLPIAPGAKSYTLFPEGSGFKTFSVRGNSTAAESAKYNTPDLVGKKIIGIRVDGLLDEYDWNSYSNVAAFFGKSQSMTGDQRVYAKPGNQRLWAAFNDGITIPEGDYYVGWFWDGCDSESSFVGAASGVGTAGSIYTIHAPNDWVDQSSSYGPAPITIYYVDQMPAKEYKVGIEPLGDMTIFSGQASQTYAYITSESWNIVNSYTYIVKVDGKQVGDPVTISSIKSWVTGITPGYANKTAINIPAIDEVGNHTVEVIVTQVDDQPNASANGTASFTVKVEERREVTCPEGCIPASLVAGDAITHDGYSMPNVDMAMKFKKIMFRNLKVVGAEIRGLGAGLDSIKLWYRNSLTGENIDCVDAYQYGDKAGAIFNTPVKITSSGPYFGCTVHQIAGKGYPVPLGEPKEVTDGCWINSGYYGWQNFFRSGTLMLTLFVEADGIADNSLQIGDCVSENVVSANEEFQLRFNAINTGKNPIKTVEYNLTLGDEQNTGTSVIGNEIPVLFGAQRTITMPVSGVAQVGDLQGNMIITKVNGEANPYDYVKSPLTVKVVAQKAVKRPLFEEYTGTGCGWCPRGILAMHEMEKQFPDFIAAVYHLYFTDPMTPEGINVPWGTDGAPDANIDRTGQIDPYYGSGNEDMGVIKNYVAACEESAPADLDIQAVWNDGMLDVESTTRFAYEEAGSTFKLGYILTASHLSGEGAGWLQSNFYLGRESDADNPYLGQLVDGSYDLSVYDDIVLTGSKPQGIDNSLPATIKANEVYTNKVSFDLRDNELVEGPDYLKAIVVLIDNTGKVRNARMVKANQSTTGITDAADNNKVVPVYYDLMGRRVANPQHGIFIKVTGSKTQKVAF